MADFESGHWYDRDGVLVPEQPYAGKRAGFRPTTLRDARKFQLLPSVTTIIAILDKPGLREWKLNWAIEIALKMPSPDLASVREEADAYVEWAAEQGSKIHLGLSEHFHGRPLAIEPEVDAVVHAFWPWYESHGYVLARSEHPVVSPLGYAGTVDYEGTHYGKPCIVDFKTQDFEDLHGAMFYDEQPLQLSGYALAAGWLGHERRSVILSRQVPGLIAEKDWSADAERHDAAFLALWSFWQHMKNYYPGRLYDVDQPR